MSEGPPKAENPKLTRREVLTGLGATAAVVLGPTPSLPKTPEDPAQKVGWRIERVTIGLEEVRALFSEVEGIFDKEGREGVKPLLEPVYKALQMLNNSNMSDWKKIWVWNSEGGLKEEEFDELNLRRKALSNAVGIMTKDGVRHDLNPGVEPYSKKA